MILWDDDRPRVLQVYGSASSVNIQGLYREINCTRGSRYRVRCTIKFQQSQTAGSVGMSIQASGLKVSSSCPRSGYESCAATEQGCAHHTSNGSTASGQRHQGSMHSTGPAPARARCPLQSGRVQHLSDGAAGVASSWASAGFPTGG